MWRDTRRIDYKETFSLVSSKDSFRIIMALVSYFDLELHQMDVKTTFLNGDIDETIYAMQKTLCPETQKIWFANLRNPSMGLNKHFKNGISSFIK